MHQDIGHATTHSPLYHERDNAYYGGHHKDANDGGNDEPLDIDGEVEGLVGDDRQVWIWVCWTLLQRSYVSVLLPDLHMKNPIMKCGWYRT